MRPVTPLAGVWIEIGKKIGTVWLDIVTPLAGVWIEIFLHLFQSCIPFQVTPLAGVWIEILVEKVDAHGARVTPLAGVWIEILGGIDASGISGRHSPCGSVD